MLYVGGKGRRFLAGYIGGNQSSIASTPIASGSLKFDWQKHVFASRMFDDAALMFQEIAPYQPAPRCGNADRDDV